MGSSGEVLLIAEIGQAHEGSLGLAHSYIDALSETGINAIKFQTHLAYAESSEFEPFRVKFSYEDESRYQYWKRMEFTESQWIGLKDHCSEKGLEFISSPFSLAAVDLLERVGIKRYKVGSGEVSNLLLLEKIARTKKPIIISSGLSSLTEIRQAVNFLKPFGNSLSLLQCTTAYPTIPEQWGLNVMNIFHEEFSIPVGFSDHSGSFYAGLAAVSLGAQILEFHVVFDKQMFGPDSKASLTVSEVGLLVKGVRQIEKALSVSVSKNNIEGLQNLRQMFGKSLAVNKNLIKGHVITFDDLEAKKPSGYGIEAFAYQDVIGKRVCKNLSAFSFLNVEDLE